MDRTRGQGQGQGQEQDRTGRDRTGLGLVPITGSRGVAGEGGRQGVVEGRCRFAHSLPKSSVQLMSHSCCWDWMFCICTSKAATRGREWMGRQMKKMAGEGRAGCQFTLTTVPTYLVGCTRGSGPGQGRIPRWLQWFERGGVLLSSLSRSDFLYSARSRSPSPGLSRVRHYHHTNSNNNNPAVSAARGSLQVCFVVRS